ncbi:MAG: 30S ribosome-binding factor RbfA [Sulfurovum sp.]|nr:MAG: 30S ribosome-binding factor RbfA [Sulfurovum sp.]
MTQEEIKRHRTESVLKEIIPEALATLDDERINALLVTDVICSKGRSDAKVFLDKSLLTPNEQREALRQLRRVSGYIQNHCKQSEGWFRAPRLSFEFDEQPEKQRRMEALFAQISKKREGSDES